MNDAGGVAQATPPLIFLVAGEPSGDLLGARLMAALKTETGGRVRFAGVGGARMAEEGLRSLFPIRELAVMGIVEVLPHALNIYRRIRQTAAAAEAARPAALVTIDSPSFTLEVSQRLKGRGIPLIHYVAPSVWAWKAWRAKHIAGFLDHLLALLPFEPPYFERHGLATTFVGHPAIEMGNVAVDPARFRARHGIAPAAPLLTVLPGSRKSEVKRLAPVFGATLGLLASRHEGLRAIVPTVETVAELVEAATRSWPVPALVLRDPAEKYQAFAASTAALAASGTVAVELAVAGLPAVIGYRLNWLSGALARRLVKAKYVSLVNLVLDRPLQAELLLGACTPERLAAALEVLLDDADARAAHVAGCREAVARLSAGDETPSRRAARVVLQLAAAQGVRK
jgi:lipid-A-disaccharide synthase